MSGETPPQGTNDYMIHEDRRRRQKERLLTAPYVESNNFEHVRVHEKDRHPSVEYRITPFARKVGEEVAALFGMSLSQYAKAVLYHNLGLVFEPVDRRKKRH
jgi:hypothetical protein